MKYLLLSVLAVSNVFAGESFECRLSSRSSAFQLAIQQYGTSPTVAQFNLMEASLAPWKSSCLRKNPAQCGQDPSCVGVITETQEICRTHIVGARDERTHVNITINELGVALVRP